MTNIRHPKVMGQLSARVRGLRYAMAERAETALEAARLAEDDRHEAALRGKAAAYREAERAIAALENGTSLPKKRKSLSDWTKR